ncbi:MAG: hypothetical protein IKE65_00025 [Clostridia bacterium]|nr:hypothetical protein [Clostridia bacterium]
MKEQRKNQTFFMACTPSGGFLQTMRLQKNPAYAILFLLKKFIFGSLK